MSRVTIISAAAIIAMLAPSVCADDLNPPFWRGDPGTTLQMWEFGTAANPTPPDVVANPYGDPLLTVAGNFPYTLWKATDFGHQGVWRFEDWMILEIPNNPEPNDHKYIWMQITYSSGYGHDPELFTLPPEASIMPISKVQLDDYYWHGTYVITITPNCAFETIYIEPRDCTAYIDEIVVDTICIPEPASLLLLAVAGLFLRRR